MTLYFAPKCLKCVEVAQKTHLSEIRRCPTYSNLFQPVRAWEREARLIITMPLPLLALWLIFLLPYVMYFARQYVQLFVCWVPQICSVTLCRTAAAAAPPACEALVLAMVLHLLLLLM